MAKEPFPGLPKSDCKTDGDCYIGMCISAKCSEGDENVVCFPNSSTGNTHCTDSGLECSARSKRCQPAGYTPAEPCQRALDCPSEEFCDRLGTKRCMAGRSLGEACSNEDALWTGYECASGLVCADKKCRKPCDRSLPAAGQCGENEACLWFAFLVDTGRSGVCVGKDEPYSLKSHALPQGTARNVDDTKAYWLFAGSIAALVAALLLVLVAFLLRRSRLQGTR